MQLVALCKKIESGIASSVSWVSGSDTLGTSLAPSIFVTASSVTGPALRALKPVRTNTCLEKLITIEADVINKAPYNPRSWEQHLQSQYGREMIETHTLPRFSEPNVKLAGQQHPVSGVVFDQRGYPYFDSISVFELKLTKPLSMDFVSGKEMADLTSKTHRQMATQMMRDAWNEGKFNRNDLMRMEVKRIEALEKYAGTPAAKKIKDFERIIDRSLMTSNVDRMISTLKSTSKSSALSSLWTWHHHADFGRMQLMSRHIHALTGHVGGDTMLHITKKVKNDILSRSSDKPTFI